MTSRRPAFTVAVTAVTLALLSGCLVGPDGEFESVSGGAEGGTTGPTFPPDAEACEFPSACDLEEPNPDAQCCEHPQPPVALVAQACPAAEVYPNAATCVDSECVRPGCAADAECTDLVPGYVCVDMGSEGRCAPSCAGDAARCYTEHKLPVSFDCDVVFGKSICVQPT